MTPSDDAVLRELREKIDYDPLTGAIVWGLAHSKAGRAVGSINSRGYRLVRFAGATHRLHRLMWFYVFGEFPREHIDHINGNRDDNRLGNLRDVSQAINNQNLRRPFSTNLSSGLLGVYFESRLNAYRAALTVKGKRHNLGWFTDPHEAQAVYLEAKRRLHEGCTI